MARHEIKTIQPYFEAVWDGEKTFEVRKNDRDYQERDEVVQREYDPQTDTYSGRKVAGEITYVLRDYPHVEAGYVVFSFNPLFKRTS